MLSSLVFYLSLFFYVSTLGQVCDQTLQTHQSASFGSFNVLYVKVISNLSPQDVVLFERYTGSTIQVESTLFGGSTLDVINISSSFASQTLTITASRRATTELTTNHVTNFPTTSHLMNSSTTNGISTNATSSLSPMASSSVRRLDVLTWLTMWLLSASLFRWNLRNLFLLFVASCLMTIVSSQSNPCPQSSAKIVIKIPTSIYTTCVYNAGSLQCTDHSATRLGVCFDALYYTDQEYEMMRNAFGSTRMDFFWTAVEYPVRGVYNFDLYTPIVNQLLHYNVTPMFIFDYDNPLYTTTRAIDTPEQRNAFVNYAMASIAQFAGKGIIWELWNEPDGNTFWLPSNATSYSLLGVQLGQAIRQSHPNEILVGPALALTSFTDFVEVLYQNGLLEYFNVITLHPYRQTYPEDVNDVYIVHRRSINKFTADNAIPRPLAAGEWGYTNIWVDQSVQSAYVVREFLINSINEITFNMYYNWRNNGNDTGYTEDNFGVVQDKYYNVPVDPFLTKPAYNTSKILSSILSGYSFNKQLVVNVSDTLINAQSDYLALYSSLSEDGSAVLVAWTISTTPHTIDIPIGVNARLIQITLNGVPSFVSTSGSSSNSYITVTISTEPIYILIPQLVCSSSQFLSIVIASPRLDLDQFVSLDNENHQLPVTIVNPLTGPITARIFGENSAGTTIPAGQCSRLIKTIPPLLSNYVKVIVQIQIDGIGTFAMQTYQVFSQKILVSVMPTSFTSVNFLIAQSIVQHQLLNAQMSITLSTGTSLSYTNYLSFVADSSQLVTINNLTYSQICCTINQLTFVLNLTDALTGQLVLRMHRSYEIAPYSQLTAVVGAAFSDPALSFSTTSGTPPLQLNNIYMMQYTNPTSYGYALINPTGVSTVLNTSGISDICMYIYGDNSLNLISNRIIDSTYQVFQPLPITVDFTGWKYVCWTLGLTPTSFGGANDGIVHYPVSFQSYLAINGLGAKPSIVNSQILFTPPIVHSFVPGS